jgi:hypothetical protein
MVANLSNNTSERIEKCVLSLLDAFCAIDENIAAPFVSINDEGSGIFSIEVVLVQDQKVEVIPFDEEIKDVLHRS